MKVGDFKIIDANDQITLERNVKEHFDHGWELAGSMSVVHDPTVLGFRNIRFFQPMTKIEGERNTIGKMRIHRGKFTCTRRGAWGPETNRDVTTVEE